MKYRVTGRLLDVKDKAKHLEVLSGLKLKSSLLELKVDEAGEQVLDVDFVFDSEADAKAYWSEAKRLSLFKKGRVHIHRCTHMEYGESENRPCVLEEVIEG